MLEKIEQISKKAQDMIQRELDERGDKADVATYQNLERIKTMYAQLDQLIKAAKDQHATIGSYILWRHLSQSHQKLDAEQLLRNFLKVLNYRVETTFSMNEEVSKTSNIDMAKFLSMLPLIFMVAMCSIFPPALFMSFVPGLMLLISALPLAITYACDEPFSMARFYQEMAGIEKAFAYTILSSAVLVLVALSAPEVTLLAAAIALLSMVSTGLVFLFHSRHLQSKHEDLKTVTWDIQSKLNFFSHPNAQESIDELDIYVKQKLSGITA